VPILIEPGAHGIELEWREDRGMVRAFRMPQLGLESSAVNASIQTTVPEDRWLLFASGPTPALIVLAFLAAVSARERWRSALTHWKFNLMQIVFALFAAAAIAVLFEAVHNGLLGRPAMLVAGNGSADLLLRWYQDRVAGTTPAATVFSLPLWVWRVLMLALSVWLALTVVRIAGWTWQAFGSGGRWQKMRRIPKTQASPSAGPSESSAPAA